MTDFSKKTDKEILTWIKNHEDRGATETDLYRSLLLERAARAQSSQKMSFDTSMKLLSDAARQQRCVSYGELAAASGIEWTHARHQLNGTNGHLDRILEICHARGLPLLTAICVNQQNLASGELGDDALKGFAIGAERLGYRFSDPRAFHHECRDACWEWGRNR